SEDGLLERGRVTVGQPFARRKERHQRRWEDQIPEAQRRKKYFGEGADVNDPAAPGEAPDSLPWSPSITQRAVVAILEAIRPSRLGPLQQRQAAHEGHNGAGGKLVRRGDIYQTGRGRSIWQFCGDEPFGVGRDRHKAGASGQKDLAGALIVRLLDQ